MPITIKLNDDIYYMLRRIKAEMNTTYDGLIRILLANYTFHRDTRTKIAINKCDQLAWYIVKLSLAFSGYRLRKSEINYQRLIKTIKQIERFAGVDLTQLRYAIDKLREKRTRQRVVFATQIVKIARRELMVKAMETCKEELEEKTI